MACVCFSTGTDSPVSAASSIFMAGALDDAAVGGHRVAGLEHHDVAGHELGRGQVHELAVTDHLGLRGAHLLQGLESLLALGLLHHAEHRVDE